MVNVLSSWRRKNRSSPSADNNKKQKQELSELMIPTNFQCPISLDLMKDPVTLPTGITYDRENIEKWIENGNRTCPTTNQVLRRTGDFLEPELIPNHTLRKMIQEWCVENKSYGIDRIPTPRIPISSHEVKKILAGVSAAGNQKDGKRCKELVGMIKTEAKQNERSKKCFLANGITGILSSTFIAFSNIVDVLEEILSALPTFLHRGSETKNYSVLGSMDSLSNLVRFLNSNNLSARRNAVLVLTKVITSSNHHDLVQIEGFLEGLVNLIQEPICPNTTKATLLLIYHLVSSRNIKIKKRLTEMGLVETLLEILVDSDKSMSEKTLGILKEICDENEEGRRRVSGHALAVPVVVKKILRVSDLVNEFSVSILWEIGCNNNNNNGGGDDNDDVLVRAIELGAFHKMLLLIQVGCDEKTKEKASDLLRVMNLCRNNRSSEFCGGLGKGSLEFKNLNRSFQ